MRTIVLCLLMLVGTYNTYSQLTPEAYIKKVPALPHDTCNALKINVQSFANQVSSLNKQVLDDVRMRTKQAKSNAKTNEAAMKEGAMNQMSQQYGMSQEDMDKMKNAKNLSPEERKAMANKMMMQQTNISMDEAKNLKKTSEEGKKAWAEGYANEAIATSQTNPKTDGGNSAMNISTLMEEQNTLSLKVTFWEQAIDARYKQLDNDPEGKAKLDKISKWKSEWTAMAGVDYGQGNKMDSLATLIRNEQISYCKKFTSQYWEILKEHITNVNSSLPDYRRIEEISGEIATIQTNVSSPDAGSDIMCLESVNKYLVKLRQAYKYKLYFSEDQQCILLLALV